MERTGKATLVKDGLLKGNARLYRLEPPYSRESWDPDVAPRLCDHVIVSAVDAFDTGPETYIFESNAEGDVVDWGELEGSFKGDYDHERALRGLGYEVA